MGKSGKHCQHIEELIEKCMVGPVTTRGIIAQHLSDISESFIPIVEAYAGVLVAHLSGKQVSQSMQQLMQLLPKRMVETNSSVVVVDMTDVLTIDTEMVQDLINTIGSAQRLGTQVVLAGVHSTLTQALAHLSGDHSGITIRTSLIAGLWVALDILELEQVGEESR